MTIAAVKRGLAERRERLSREAGGGENVTLRLDGDVLAKFRATGIGWQSRINDALRAARV